MNSRLFPLLASTALLALPFLATPGLAKTPSPDWSPSVTERLVKLPQNHLKKSLDRDFARSPLAEAIAHADEEIKLKTLTLEDLRAAADRAEGELQIELRHQLLAEKQAYLHLVKSHQDLRSQHLQKRKQVYANILQKHLQKGGNGTPEKIELIAAQESAHARFEKSRESVNMKIFASFDSPESKYASAYAQNLSAANALLAAINNHPASRQAADAGPENKADYLRRLVADADSELALINQEGEIVGYMAKLVALDAAAFSEQIAGQEDEADLDQEQRPATVISALNQFIQ
ncbi:MAG: hypothetical protein HQ483_01725 [Rhodospirillales bacterium]|nr:hypothetical protein [Rhodospirillales bacterium]